MRVTQRAGDHGLPGESVVAEEAETSEAIHAAAHPGRVAKAEADTDADDVATSADAADAAEAVAEESAS